MNTCHLKFIKEKLECDVPAGTTILQAMRSAGILCDAPCGGHGTCGKCMVTVRTESGNKQRENLQNENRQGECLQNEHRQEECLKNENRQSEKKVLACQTAVNEDLTVVTGSPAEDMRILKSSACSASVKEPAVAEDPGDSATTEPAAADPVSANKQAVTNSAVTDPVSTDKQAVTNSAGAASAAAEPVSGGYMAAFDIGTTTVVGYLLDGKTGKEIAAKGILNPQTAYGADVISRIEAALAGKADQETACIRKAVNSVIGELCGIAGIDRKEIRAVSVVGNTCMHHLFSGIPVDTLVRIPYSPALTERQTLVPAACGLEVGENAVLEILPVIAGFVGADTVGCLLAGSWTEREEISLLIDIGTNGEMALGNKDRLVVCSTAAGPAFEGAKISCGMRGAAGAIDHVKLADGKPVYHVIGGGEAKGLCGSGLLDLIAILVELELIDESGRLEMPEFPLGDTGLTLTRRDVREVQLAKAAIAAGIKLMTEYMRIDYSKIRRVEIAGAFGSFMDVRSVCAIGMIPGQLESRIRIVGNAAGEGAKLALLDSHNLKKADALAKKAEFLELATLKNFQETFVDALEF